MSKRLALALVVVWAAATPAMAADLTLTKARPTMAQCDTNYRGACVPIASDVDCAAGSGNGPAYVAGPFHVVGGDPYGLDRDHDGLACEWG